MSEKSITVALPSGQSGSGIEIQVDESVDRWSEITLKDGTILRAKMAISSAIRVIGMYDPEGNPVYMIKGAPVTSLVSSPDNLKKKA